MKAESEAVDAISVCVFIARIHKGSRFSFERVRLNDEVSLMRRVRVEISARVLLVGNPSRKVEDTFSNYKKFVSNTRILPGVREVEPK